MRDLVRTKEQARAQQYLWIMQARDDGFCTPDDSNIIPKSDMNIESGDNPYKGQQLS